MKSKKKIVILIIMIMMMTIERKKEEEEEEYKSVNTNDYKVIYCLRCNAYIIYKRDMFENDSHYCKNCNHPRTVNVYADEFKFYFKPNITTTQKTRLVATNSPIIKQRNYSWKIIKDMDN